MVVVNDKPSFLLIFVSLTATICGGFCMVDSMLDSLSMFFLKLLIVEFVLPPQHETSYDPETTTKEDFTYII